MRANERTFEFQGYRVVATSTDSPEWTHVHLTDINGVPVLTQIVETHLVTLVILHAIDRNERFFREVSK